MCNLTTPKPVSALQQPGTMTMTHDMCIDLQAAVSASGAMPAAAAHSGNGSFAASFSALCNGAVCRRSEVHSCRWMCVRATPSGMLQNNAQHPLVPVVCIVSAA
jgi:hypothetical protein